MEIKNKKSFNDLVRDLTEEIIEEDSIAIKFNIYEGEKVWLLD